MSWDDVLEDRNRKLEEILRSYVECPGRNNEETPVRYAGKQGQGTFIARNGKEALAMRAYIRFFIASCGGVDFVDIRDVEKFVQFIAGMINDHPYGLHFRRDIVTRYFKEVYKDGNRKTVSETD